MCLLFVPAIPRPSAQILMIKLSSLRVTHNESSTERLASLATCNLGDVCTVRNWSGQQCSGHHGSRRYRNIGRAGTEPSPYPGRSLATLAIQGNGYRRPRDNLRWLRWA